MFSWRSKKNTQNPTISRALSNHLVKTFALSLAVVLVKPNRCRIQHSMGHNNVC